MIRDVEAVYEHGMQRPLEPLPLAESQRVRLAISDVVSGHSQLDLEILERSRVEATTIQAASHNCRGPWRARIDTRMARPCRRTPAW